MLKSQSLTIKIQEAFRYHLTFSMSRYGLNTRSEKAVIILFEILENIPNIIRSVINRYLNHFLKFNTHYNKIVTNKLTRISHSYGDVFIAGERLQILIYA